jgi:NADH-quinone oxidoreductase subunit M
MLREVLSVQPIGVPILSALIALPALCALLLLWVERPSRRRLLALVGAGLELALAGVLTASFTPRTSDVQFVERYRWIPSVNAEYHVGVDGISVLFIPLTALLFFAVLISSWRSPESGSRAHLASLLALEAISVGVFCALDLVLFFVFWELSLIPLYFLVSLWGVGPARRQAALKLVTTMVIGSAPLFVGILLLGENHHRATQAAGLTPTYSFDYIALLSTPIPPGLEATIFFLLLVGFAVKSPLLPFHTWLPAVVSEGRSASPPCSPG